MQHIKNWLAIRDLNNLLAELPDKREGQRRFKSTSVVVPMGAHSFLNFSKLQLINFCGTWSTSLCRPLSPTPAAI
jgi:hypothetical protein